MKSHKLKENIIKALIKEKLSWKFNLINTRNNENTFSKTKKNYLKQKLKVKKIKKK